MTGVELRTSGIGSDRSTNWATISPYFAPIKLVGHEQKEESVNDQDGDGGPFFIFFAKNCSTVNLAAQAWSSSGHSGYNFPSFDAILFCIEWLQMLEIQNFNKKIRQVGFIFCGHFVFYF